MSQFKKAGIAVRLVEGVPNLNACYEVSEGMSVKKGDVVTPADAAAELDRLAGLQKNDNAAKFAKALKDHLKKLDPKNKELGKAWAETWHVRIARYAATFHGGKYRSSATATDSKPETKATTKPAPGKPAAKKTTAKKPTAKKTTAASGKTKLEKKNEAAAKLAKAEAEKAGDKKPQQVAARKTSGTRSTSRVKR